MGVRAGRTNPLAYRGCCRSHEEHRAHLRASVVQALEAARLIPLRDDQDGHDHKLAALLALAELRRLVDAWTA